MPQTKVTSRELAPSKTTDANGWRVYDYGTWKEYRKRVTFSYSAATAPLGLSSNNLPVGVPNFHNHYLYYSVIVNGNAYGLKVNFEGSSGSSGLNFTYQAPTAQSGSMDLYIVEA